MSPPSPVAARGWPSWAPMRSCPSCRAAARRSTSSSMRSAGRCWGPRSSAWRRGARVISFAATVGEPVSFPTRELFSRAPGARAARPLHLRRARAHEDRGDRPAAAGRPGGRGASGPPDRRHALVDRGARRHPGAAGPPRGGQGRAHRRLSSAPGQRSDDRAPPNAAPGPRTASGEVSIVDVGVVAVEAIGRLGTMPGAAVAQVLAVKAPAARRGRCPGASSSRTRTRCRRGWGRRPPRRRRRASAR